MEALKITIFFAIVLMATTMVQRAVATDSHSPSPSPALDAAVFTPALFASFTARVWILLLLILPFFLDGLSSLT
ncbi:hypothetical protein AAC387_Pa06g1551 [Persea americana]